MYESDIPHRHLPADDLPDEVKSLFHDHDAEITAVSVVTWGEHCVECALPHCYTSCDLYEARADGRCRRFADGIGRVADVPNYQNGVARIAFKRWAHLMAKGTAQVVPIRRARLLERLFLALDRVVERIPDWDRTILGRRNLSSRVLMRLKHELTQRRLFADRSREPDYFLVEVWNPSSDAVKLTLRISAKGAEGRLHPFQKLLVAEPGFRRWKLPYREIAPHLDPAGEVGMQIVPNESAKGVRAGPGECLLYFGTLGFVADARWRRSAQEPTARHVKVAAWDLDDTLWDGVLLEDGAEGIKLRAGVARTIVELDRRGIVNSVISKNEPADALAQLKRFGLDEYFVFPRIGWIPKSEAMAALIGDFGVGADSVAFIDDSPFEREQISRALGSVRVYDACEAEELPERPEFDPPVTSESRRRRAHYRAQERRTRALEGFSGEYLEFLRSCAIRLTVHTRPAQHADRLHELVQRTNQLNFSGNRYTREQLEAQLADPRKDAFAIECEDRFGEYGLVGFALVEREIPLLSDLALSCRVQAKRVEHAFLAFLLQLYRERGHATFEALYRRTERNQAAGAVFADLGFAEAGQEGDRLRYRFDLKRPIPDDRLAELRVEP